MIKYLEGNSGRSLRHASRPVISFHAEPDSVIAPVPETARKLYLLKREKERLQGNIVEAFLCRQEANAELARRRSGHQQSWLARPWFQLPELTSLSPEVFRDAVLDLGLEPPPAGAEDDEEVWAAWWQEQAPLMGEWRRQQFVALLDRLAPFLVVEVPLVE
jgi:hypothetical protein